MDSTKEELEEFEYYLNAEFSFEDSILFSNVVKQPSSEDLSQLMSTWKKVEIEKFYNHFHLMFITTSPERQRFFAFELWKKWREFFKTHFPQKNIVIEISDYGPEVILCVYQSESLEGKP